MAQVELVGSEFDPNAKAEGRAADEAEKPKSKGVGGRLRAAAERCAAQEGRRGRAAASTSRQGRGEESRRRARRAAAKRQDARLESIGELALVRIELPMKPGRPQRSRLVCARRTESRSLRHAVRREPSSVADGERRRP